MIHIRKATADDALTAWQIRQDAIRHQCSGHYSPDQLDNWLSGKPSERFRRDVGSRFYLACYHSEPAGTGLLDLSDGSIGAIFVDPRYMQRGVGRAMMHHLERLALGIGLTTLTLDATLNAAPFYRHLGYTGEELGTYTNSRGLVLPCVPMRKTLVGNAGRLATK